jgi:hypothetical protein
MKPPPERPAEAPASRLPGHPWADTTPSRVLDQRGMIYPKIEFDEKDFSL